MSKPFRVTHIKLPTLTMSIAICAIFIADLLFAAQPIRMESGQKPIVQPNTVAPRLTNQQISSLSSEISHLEKLLQEKIGEMKSLRANMPVKPANAASDEQIREYQAKYDQWRRKVSRLSQDMRAIQLRIEKAQKELSRLQSGLPKAGRSDQRQREAQLERMQQRMNRLKKKNKAAASALHTINTIKPYKLTPIK